MGVYGRQWLAMAIAGHGWQWPGLAVVVHKTVQYIEVAAKPVNSGGPEKTDKGGSPTTGQYWGSKKSEMKWCFETLSRLPGTQAKRNETQNLGPMGRFGGCSQGYVNGVACPNFRIELWVLTLAQ